MSEQEPVAWISESENLLSWDKFYDHMKPLYTAPPKNEWVGLTNEEIQKLQHQNWEERWLYVEFARAIEAKLKEKNT